jgi:hypothetical protein
VDGITPPTVGFEPPERSAPLPDPEESK